MDVCVLCLEKIKSLKLRINIFAKKTTKNDVESVIKSYFWLKPDPTKHKFICKECWEHLHDFHEFYIRIQEAHSALEAQVEAAHVTQESSSSLATVQRRGRGRPPKSTAATIPTVVEQPVAEELKTTECSENKMQMVPEVKLEEAQAAQAETEFMDLFYNIVEEKQIQPLQEVTIKDELAALTENLSAADPIEEQLAEEEEQLAQEEEPAREMTNETKKKKEKPAKQAAYNEKTLSSKHTDEFIAKNFILNCHLCMQTMETFAALKQHFRAKHNTRGYALCCGKKLLKRCVLLDHVQFHLNPKYFKCTRCEKVMCDRRSLEKHKESHDDKKERIFSCPTCSKSFFRRSIYQRHLLLHLPADQKTVKCLKCEKT